MKAHTPAHSTDHRITASALDFTLPPELEAHAPAEARGAVDRSDVRLMVSVGTEAPVHTRFGHIGEYVRPGDVLVVNTSAMINAAIDGCIEGVGPVVVHFSAELGHGRWVVELRRPVLAGEVNTTTPFSDDVSTRTVALVGGAVVQVVERLAGSERLWEAVLWSPVPMIDHLASHGRPIRYAYVPEQWPLSDYQTVFGRHPGSAEMPSASRPFTPETIVDLVTRGVQFAPVLLHTGVSSLERHEAPYPERFIVPAATAEMINAAHANGHRVIAVGTTAVRATESATDENGRVHAAAGWTDLLITPERGVRAIDGLLTGWHEPEATHLLMLEAVAGAEPLQLAYPEAIAHRYYWHEFGDVHLLLPSVPPAESVRYRAVCEAQASKLENNSVRERSERHRVTV